LNTVNVYDQLASVAQKVRKCPSITLARAYNRAFRDFCSQTQWLTVPIPGATVANVRDYSLGSDPYVDIVGVNGMQGSITTNGQTQYWAIGPSNSGSWDPSIQPAMPIRYAYLSQAQFALDPLPDQVYQLLVSAIVTPKEGAALIPEAPLIKYSNQIEAGALAYLLDIPGQAWSNPVLAEKNSRIFQSGIANAKAEVQRAFNTGSQRARPRAFVR
jgi:hypothetical protein